MTSPRMDFVLMLHSHLPYVLNHGRWPHGSDWICEAAIDTYLPLIGQVAGARCGQHRRAGDDRVHAGAREPARASELSPRSSKRTSSSASSFCDEAPEALRSTHDEQLCRSSTTGVSAWNGCALSSAHSTADILDGFRALQDRERIEITSSAATHGFLPLLGRDESITLQLALGFAEHRRIFGRDPVGCWVPECAYRPAGPLAAPAQRADPGKGPGSSTSSGRPAFATSSSMRTWRAREQPLGVYAQMVARGTGAHGHADADGAARRALAIPRLPRSPRLTRRARSTCWCAIRARRRRCGTATVAIPVPAPTSSSTRSAGPAGATSGASPDLASTSAPRSRTIPELRGASRMSMPSTSQRCSTRSRSDKASTTAM